MNKLLRIKPGVLIISLVFIFAQLLLSTECGFAAEFFPDGGFEIGNVHLEIARSPRYGSPYVSAASIDTTGLMDGMNSLWLPGSEGIEYRLMSNIITLQKSKDYTVTFKLLASGSCMVRIEAFIDDKVITNIAQKNVRLEKGLHIIPFRFTSASIEDRHWLRIVLASKDGVWMDSLSLTGPSVALELPESKGIWLEPDKPAGVYRVGEQGFMPIRFMSGTARAISYQIVAEPSGKVILSGEKIPGKDSVVILPINTEKPGYFRLEAHYGAKSSSRAYAVITQTPQGRRPDTRFGLCMEEHPGPTYIGGAIQPNDLYALAHDMGAGSARVFSLAFPERLSKDGKVYDFSELDAALSMAEKYGIRVIIPLGTQIPYKIPDWLRTGKAEGNVDLLGGGRTNKLKILAERFGGKRYLDIERYEKYLEKLMEHVKGEIHYFEIWNEPGHKFSVDDTLKLARAVKRVRDRVYPDAKILGYSSTKGKGIGQGMDLRVYPEYLNEIAEKGGLDLIDVLSYHSGHAFLFMGRSFDLRDQETGYVGRIKKIAALYGKENMAIWDTERGLPWKSAASVGGEITTDKDNDIDIDRTVSVLDAARQLPMVYAAGIANGVEVINWFVFDANTGQIYKPDYRWVMHDVNGEPSPMIPAYDAMTDMLYGAKFHRSLDRSDGVRAYLFDRGQDTVIMAYNWQEKKTGLSINGWDSEGAVYDIYGNQISTFITGTDIMLDGWPVYIVFKGINPEQLTVN